MTSKVEEVARAIYHGKPRNRPWEKLTPEFQRQYHKQARAAIKAMREPTKAMEGAAHDEMEGYGLGRYTPIIPAYRGMIDAALREEGR